jgi:hypothetical protein
MEIVVEPWKKLIIHEVVEYAFEDFMKLLISQSRAVAGGSPAINWSNGIVFNFSTFPDTDSVIKEKLQGVIHWANLMFALKERYESQYRQGTDYVNLVNASQNDTFVQLADVLKKNTKFAGGQRHR